MSAVFNNPAAVVSGQQSPVDQAPDTPVIVPLAEEPGLHQSDAAAGPGRRAGERWVETKSGIAFRYIPAGTWMMGSPVGEPGRRIKEVYHEVTLTRGFWIGETEVTQKQWQQLMGKNPARFDGCGENCPVENVNWYKALKFCNALSVRAGFQECYTFGGGGPVFAGLQCNGFRLPTEAEWERAARAGTQTALYTGQLTIPANGNSPELDPIAWFSGNSGVQYAKGVDCSWWRENIHEAARCGTHAVGQRKPTQWKVHDMLGNVWEWTWDTAAGYPSGSVTDPFAPEGPEARVIRGCGWDSSARDCRVANRDNKPAKSRSPSVGVRLARTADSNLAESSGQ